jgi:hypothetical protein
LANSRFIKHKVAATRIVPVICLHMKRTCDRER